MLDVKDDHAQITIIGAGPVGILLSILLGQQGRRVTLVERWPDIYDRPRAVTMDHEVARILASLGIDCDHDPAFENHKELYYWKNADLENLQIVDWKSLAPSGWHVTYWFNQPELEYRLMGIAQTYPSITIMRGWQVMRLHQDANGVDLSIQQTPEVFGPDGEQQNLRADYVIGADGANSFVRDAVGISMVDNGYFFDWLILDMIPHANYKMSPLQWQLCDPRRPTTLVPGGPGRRRWEFMVLPGESSDEIAKPESAWKLLEPWGLDPENAELERSAVYRFQARWAEKWRVGRCLIAGDAAHLMPPFAGEGMCAGLRDAMSLGWRLNAILEQTMSDKILDSYESERMHHARHYIDFSQQLGEIICIADPEKAAERDQNMMAALAARNHEPITGDLVHLGPGVWCQGTTSAGELSPQGVVEFKGKRDRFDQAVGQGWFVVAVNGTVDGLLTKHQLSVLNYLDGKIVSIGSSDTAYDILDVDNAYAEWMSKIDASFFILRPDFYVAATAKTKAELQLCFDDVVSSLNLIEDNIQNVA